MYLLEPLQDHWTEIEDVLKILTDKVQILKKAFVILTEVFVTTVSSI